MSKQRSWFLLSAAFSIASMFDDPQISLHYNLKHYELKLRLLLTDSYCGGGDMKSQCKSYEGKKRPKNGKDLVAE